MCWEFINHTVLCISSKILDAEYKHFRACIAWYTNISLTRSLESDKHYWDTKEITNTFYFFLNRKSVIFVSTKQITRMWYAGVVMDIQFFGGSPFLKWIYWSTCKLFCWSNQIYKLLSTFISYCSIYCFQLSIII